MIGGLLEEFRFIAAQVLELAAQNSEWALGQEEEVQDSQRVSERVPQLWFLLLLAFPQPSLSPFGPVLLHGPYLEKRRRSWCFLLSLICRTTPYETRRLADQPSSKCLSIGTTAPIQPGYGVGEVSFRQRGNPVEAPA